MYLIIVSVFPRAHPERCLVQHLVMLHQPRAARRRKAMYPDGDGIELIESDLGRLGVGVTLAVGLA